MSSTPNYELTIAVALNIVEYIDENWNSSGPSILPSDPRDRALSRFWSAFVDNKWFSALKAAAITKSEDAKAKYMEEVEEGLLKLEDAFVSMSKGKPFFGGETIGFMDICFGSFLVIMKAREKLRGEKLLDVSKIPCLCKWADEFLSDETVKNVVPEVGKLADFLAELESKAQAAASRS